MSSGWLCQPMYSLAEFSSPAGCPGPGSCSRTRCPLPTYLAHGHPPFLGRRWRTQRRTLCMAYGCTPGCWCCQGSVRCPRASSSTRSRHTATAPRTTTSSASRVYGTTRTTGSTCRTAGIAARCQAGAWVEGVATIVGGKGGV